MAARTAVTLVHRGPDDFGSWADPGGEAAFGFQRLSILDLTPEGHQPMTSSDGRFDAWLRGPLREWAQDLLSEQRLAREGFFDPAPVRSALREHPEGRRNRQYQLWTVLMFQSWLEQHESPGRPA